MAHVLIGSKTYYKTCACLHFGQYLCYYLEFLYNFFTEHSPYQYLQDAIPLVFLSDKTTEKIEVKNPNWPTPVLQARENLPKSQDFQANCLFPINDMNERQRMDPCVNFMHKQVHACMNHARPENLNFMPCFTP